MYKKTRQREDYKVGDECYFIQILFNVKKEIYWKKVVIEKTDGNDINVRTIKQYIPAYHQNSDVFDVTYNWLAKTFDEALQEFKDYDITDKQLLKNIFGDSKWHKEQ